LHYLIINNNQVIGAINFDSIAKGVFQAGYLGYSLDGYYQGAGIMTQFLKMVTKELFGK